MILQVAVPPTKDTSEVVLWKYVLNQALEDVGRCGDVGNAALYWFLQQERYVGSFRWVCEAINRDPLVIKAMLIKQLWKAAWGPSIRMRAVVLAGGFLPLAKIVCKPQWYVRREYIQIVRDDLFLGKLSGKRKRRADKWIKSFDNVLGTAETVDLVGTKPTGRVEVPSA